MSYGEARNRFEKARNNTADPGIIDMLEGFKRLSHAIEEDVIIEHWNRAYAMSVTPKTADSFSQLR